MSNALSVRGLTKSYRGRRVLDGLTFEVPEGAIALYLGPNGAGKTTTFRLLSGLEAPDAGEIHVFERPWDPRVRRFLGVTLEEPRFYPWLTGLENVEIAFRYRRVKNPARAALKALERVGLTYAARRRFRDYSLGMRQRLYLAAQLFPGVRLLLLDEPTNGLDVEGREEVWSTLQALTRQGVSLFVSTHQVLEAERFAEYLVVLHKGRVAYQGTYRDLAKRRRFVLRVDDVAEALAALRAAGFEAFLGRRPGELYVENTAGKVDRLLACLTEAGVQVLDQRFEDLEELYWRIKDGLERAA